MIEAPAVVQEPSEPGEALGLIHGPCGATTGRPGVQATIPEADPALTLEAVAAAIAELESRIAARAPRPPEAMERIRLKNLRDLRDGTWKADPRAGGAPVETPRMVSWPASPPVETADLIRRLVSPGSGPAAVEAAAVRVSERLGDGHSLTWYRKAFGRVQSGEVPLVKALAAWRSASGGTAKSPGAVFNALLKGGVR